MSIIDKIVQTSSFLWKIDDRLKRYKPIHLCWLFDKLGLPVPRYFVGDPGYGSDLCVGGTPTACCYYGTDTPAKAFDNNNTTMWRSGINGNHWLQYDFGAGNAKVVTKFTLASYDNELMSSGNYWFRGSNNLSAWDTLKSGSGNWHNTVASFTFTNTTAYRYYRIEIDSNAPDNRCQVFEMQMMESEPVAPSGCATSYVATDNAKCTWNDNSQNETGFRIEKAIDGGGYSFWKNVGAGVTDSGTYTLGANHRIIFRVLAYNAVGNSAWSTSPSYIYTTPAAPTGATTVYVATNLAKLTWTDASAYESGFRLEYAYGAAGWLFWKNVGAGVQDSGNGNPGPNTRAKFRVRSYIGSLVSAYSEGSYVYTTPTAPSGVGISWATLNETITVSWTDNSAYEQDFEIAKDKDGGWTYGTYDVASPYSDTAPTGLDHRYRHAVRARCPDGRLSAWAYSGYIYSTPNTPSGIALSWLSQDETVRITYTDNATYNQDIDIEKATDGGGYGHLVYDVASPYDDTAPSGLNHRYIYRIRARCPDGQLSGWNTASKYMHSTPSIPTALSLSWLLQDETVRVVYTKNHPYGDLDIYKAIDAGASAHLVYDATSPYDDTAPTGLDHKYIYKIRARTSQNDDGTYEYSSFTSVATIYSIPNAPSGCSISLGTINISWTDNSAYEDGFQVERQLDTGGWNLIHTSAAEAEFWADTSQPTGSNEKYEYRVRAKIGTLYSTYSTSNAIFVKIFAESITLSDVYSRVWNIYRIFTESISLSDAYSRVCNWFRTFTESINLTDTYTRVWTRFRTFTENITLTDTIKKAVTKTFSETISLSDVFSRIWTIYRTFTETLNLADTLIKKPIKTFIESLHLTDTLIKKPAKIFTETITLVDTLKKRTHRIFTETLSLTDTVSKKVIKTFLETLHLQDRYTRVVSWYRTFTEKITLVDTVKKVKSNLVQLWKKLMNLFDIEGH